MLGLGMEMTKGGVVGKPPIADGVKNHAVYWLASDSIHDGAITNVSPPTSTVGDLRLGCSNVTFVPPVSAYTITSVTIENTSTSSSPTEILTEDISLDGTATYVNLIYYLSNDATPIDDLDFGSSSSYAFKHSGSGQNNFVVRMTITHDNFEGSLTISSNLVLTDSDA